jgi:hypothetical protein
VDEIGSMLEHSLQKSLVCLAQKIIVSRTKPPKRTSMCKCNTVYRHARNSGIRTDRFPATTTIWVLFVIRYAVELLFSLVV